MSLSQPPTPRMRRLFSKLAEQWGQPTRVAAIARFQSPLHIAVWEDPAGGATALNTLGLSDVAVAADGLPIELHWLVKQSLATDEQAEAIAFLAELSAAAMQPTAAFDWQTRVQAAEGIPRFSNCREVWLHPAFTGDDPDTLEDADGLIKLLYVIPLTEYESFVLAQQGPAALLDYTQANGIDLLSPR